MKKEKRTAIGKKPKAEKVSEYKDLKKTPTAKVGIAAGPLTNGPQAIPTDAADAQNPNA